MAPESYRDEKCTEKIDIYSLAMMIWEMLTGQLPWDGWNFQVLLARERARRWKRAQKCAR